MPKEKKILKVFSLFFPCVKCSFKLSFGVYTCVNMWAGAQVCTGTMYMCVHGGQRWAMGVFLDPSKATWSISNYKGRCVPAHASALMSILRALTGSGM